MMLKRRKITVQKALRLGKQSVCLQMCPLLNWLVNSQCGVSRGSKMSVTLFQKQQLDPCITQSKWKCFFCQDSQKGRLKLPCTVTSTEAPRCLCMKHVHLQAWLPFHNLFQTENCVGYILITQIFTFLQAMFSAQ